MFSRQIQLASCVRQSDGRKEVRTVKYETPEVTCLTSAIDAVRGITNKAGQPGDSGGGSSDRESNPAYEDWE
jgi:hypothetical protein